MSILSTNQRLISLGQDYSAGENIGINDRVISSRNWTPDITYAAESAFQRANEYTNTQISALSGEVSSEVSQLGSDIDYISGVALTAHQSLEGYLTKASGDEYYQPIGSYATVSQLESTSGEIVNLIPTDYVSNETLEQTSGNIVNLIPDTSEFITNASAEQTYQHIGNYLSSNALEGYATQDWVGEQGYITGVDLSNYYTKNETSGADELANAFSQIGPGDDEEVNYVVHTYSANGTWLVANDITGLQEKGDYYSASNPSGFLVPNDISNLASISLVEETSGSIVNLIPDTSNFITNASAESTYQTIDGMTAYQPVGDYATTAEVDSISSILSGAIDYVSANAGDEFPASADEAIQYVQTNSGTIDDVNTTYQTNSATYLTAHQAISADEWNSNYETVNTNSGVWGGDALPISAGPGIKVNLVDNTLVFSNDETLIFNGDVSGQVTDFNTNEQINNFEKLDVYYCCNDDGLSLLGGNITTYDTNVLTAQNQISLGGTYTISNGYTCFYNLYYTITNGSAFSCTQSKRYWLAPTATSGEGNVAYNPTTNVEKKKNGYIYKIVGINRK